VPTRRVTALDDFVGARTRERRTDLSLSAHQIREKINLAYQQVLNYEHGQDRVSASRLYEIAYSLNTPIGYFYEGLDDAEPRRILTRQGRHRQLDMARHLDGIHNEKHLAAISRVARAFAGR
jgi:transcriptional regulator with XRE-family HTH domain